MGLQTVSRQATGRLEIFWANMAMVLAGREVFRTDTEAKRIYE